MIGAQNTSTVATILNGDYARAIPLVSSFFTVREFQHNAKDDYVEFLIAESDVRHKFQSLQNQLNKIGMVVTAGKSQYLRWLMPTLKSVRLSTNGGTVLTVHRLPKQRAKKNLLRFLPLALFLTTLAVVFIDGIIRYDPRFGVDPIMLAILYTMSVMGILGIHELGHMIAAKHHGIRISWPYFVPTYPGLIFIPPTLGAMIRLKSYMPGRNAMFDVGISGPIAGLVVTVIVSMYGAAISETISLEEAQRLYDDGQLFRLNPSLLIMAAVEITDMANDGQVLIWSPILYAAWLGSLLTFLNLLPAAQLDGGHIARATLGTKHHRVLTLASVGALFAMFYPTMGALVLFLAIRAPAVQPLDDVTPVSRWRKMLFVIAIVFAVVCAPLPPYL